MFIVAMTLAVLASVGVYALAAAATEIKTSGFERQNTQTHYLAEYAIVGASQYVSGTMAQWIVGAMAPHPGKMVTNDTCPLSLPNVASSADTMVNGCRRLGAPDMASQWAAPYSVTYSGTAPLLGNVQPGSFGPIPMRGDFFAEVTEPWKPKAPSGYGLSQNMCFIEFTVTASGMTQPQYPSASDSDTPRFGSEGVEVQRARIVAGPTQCSSTSSNSN